MNATLMKHRDCLATSRLCCALVLSALLTAMLCRPLTARGADAAASATSPSAVLEAQFRGCESAQLCRFWIASLAPDAAALLRVRPNGVRVDRDANAIAVRDRLNALMSNMIHQYKHIELREVRELGGGLFAATVIIDGMALQADPVLRELMQSRAQTGSSRGEP